MHHEMLINNHITQASIRVWHNEANWPDINSMHCEQLIKKLWTWFECSIDINGVSFAELLLIARKCIISILLTWQLCQLLLIDSRQGYALLPCTLPHRGDDSVGRGLCLAWWVHMFPCGCSQLTTLQSEFSFTGPIPAPPPRLLPIFSYLLVDVTVHRCSPDRLLQISFSKSLWMILATQPLCYSFVLLKYMQGFIYTRPTWRWWWHKQI